MIAFDSNVLVYAHRSDAPFHEPARAAVRAAAEGPDSWALLWPCLHEFYCVVTSPRIQKRPTPPAAALDQLLAWTESPAVGLLAESSGHLATVTGLLVAAQTVGPAVYDAKIAAICLSYGVSELVTMDSDFSRYPSLKTRSLLA